MAFDTLFKEGKRRYLESLSTHAKYLLGPLEKPKFESIRGLSPTISIEQKNASSSPRSTVGTVTELLDRYRILFARLGVLHCFQCKKKIESLSAAQIVEKLFAKKQLLLLAPLIENETGNHQAVFSFCKAEGFTRVRVNQEIFRLEEIPELKPQKKHCIDLVVDRLTLHDEIRPRLTESVETALRMGRGRLIAFDLENEKEEGYSEKNTCLDCQIDFPPLSPAAFSFNSPHGMCPECKGLGFIENPEAEPKTCATCQGTRLRQDLSQVLFHSVSLPKLSQMSLEGNLDFFQKRKPKLSVTEKRVAQELIDEIINRLSCLVDLGLPYLTLDRLAGTLSGGEFQRIHLGSQIDSELTGILYVLDEPSAGLHPRDNQMLLQLLKKLQTRGNTLVLVEHSPELMRA
ncbi:MAG: hypothetical protein KDK61_08730, partial [Simkania sp.]|nr:hypothetical protein [Simkania sp.]